MKVFLELCKKRKSGTQVNKMWEALLYDTEDCFPQVRFNFKALEGSFFLDQGSKDCIYIGLYQMEALILFANMERLQFTLKLQRDSI